MQRMSITLEDDIKHELDNITSKSDRDAFISKSIKQAISDYHKQQALKKILAFKPYKIDRNSVDVLHEVREGKTTQVIKASK